MNIKHDRSHVLQTGISLFRKNGYESLGIDKICSETGMTKGAFYHAFNSKEAFLLSCLDTYAEQNLKYIRSFLQNTALSPLDRLLNLYSTMLSGQSQANYAGCLINNTMNELAANHPIINQKTEILFNDLLSEISILLAESQEVGELPASANINALAELIHTTFFGVLTRLKSSKNSAKAIETMSFLLHNINTNNSI